MGLPVYSYELLTAIYDIKLSGFVEIENQPPLSLWLLFENLNYYITKACKNVSFHLYVLLRAFIIGSIPIHVYIQIDRSESTVVHIKKSNGAG